jgi:hypothetical protein
MKKILTVVFIFALAINVLAQPSTKKGKKTEKVPLCTPVERKDLEVPQQLWDKVKENVNYKGKFLGYTFEEMANFPAHPFRLRVIENLFREVASIPRFSGLISDMLLEKPEQFDTVAMIAYSLLDARAGRDIQIPTKEKWGIEWIPDVVSPDSAFSLILDYGAKREIKEPISSKELKLFKQLPDGVKKLVVRMILASIQATPIVKEAYDESFLAQSFNVDDLKKIPRQELYKFATAPWQDSVDEVFRSSFEALDKIDLNYLAFGSITYFKLVRAAIEEFQKWREGNEITVADFGKISFKTVVGQVAILGVRADTISGDFSLVIDLGGNDRYIGKTGVPRSFLEPISAVIDLSGNDTYDSGKGKGGLGCGLFGIGAIFDLSGNDTYVCQESGIGCGWYGSGLVIDYSGNDSYTTNFAWGEGAAHCGIGMLIDLKGSDQYNCATESQGFGSTLGVGILLDVSGNDNYLAYKEGRPSAPFNNKSVSFAQGAGFGRRADGSDGHSLAGGIGISVDGSGDDNYSGVVYCQGTGYWWSLGILEDHQGNDTYQSAQYSLGSAPHFAIGCCVDLSGDDKYNISNPEIITQTQGCARDGSIGIFIDGAGNDQYYHRNRCAGAGDLNSIALFWDRCGDDSYICNRQPPYSQDRSYGAATTYPPFRTFRDYLPAVGIFLDTGGKDSYKELMPASETEKSPMLGFGENNEWRQNAGPNSWGFGLDTDWNFPVPKDKK